MHRNRYGRLLLAFVVILLCLGVLAGLYVYRRIRGRPVPPPLPLIPTALPFDPWPTLQVADGFDYPLQPAESYAPYMQGITGPLVVDTRYGVQNAGHGNRANCFRNVEGGTVPFSQLYHAGVDLFAVDGAGKTVWGEAAHAPVHAVADGVAISTLDAGGEGHIVIIEHALTGEGSVHSVYWHADHVQVEPGQPVVRGQVVAVVKDLGWNSHLHWEMRTFPDGSDLFAAGTAGEPGCNGHVAGVGYTWDDDPARAAPDFYGYLDPMAFVETHRP